MLAALALLLQRDLGAFLTRAILSKKTRPGMKRTRLKVLVKQGGFKPPLRYGRFALPLGHDFDLCTRFFMSAIHCSFHFLPWEAFRNQRFHIQPT